jgi:hypothetical protein
MEEQDNSSDPVRLDQELTLRTKPLGTKELSAADERAGPSGNVEPIITGDAQSTMEEIIDLVSEASVRAGYHERAWLTVPPRTVFLTVR